MEQIYEFDGFRLDTQNLSLTKDGQAIKIEPKVFLVLSELVRHHGEIITRSELINRIWQGRQVSAGLLDSRLSAARKAIGDDGKKQKFIKTCADQGLKFVGDVREISDEVQLPQKDPEIFAVLLRWGSGFRALLSVVVLALVAVVSIMRIIDAEDSPPVAQLRQTASSLESQVSSIQSNVNAAPSIVVFPIFQTNGTDEGRDIIETAAWQTHSILSYLTDLSVISASASFGLVERGISQEEAKKLLASNYRLELTAFPAEGGHSIAAQLVSTHDEMVAWSKRYEIADQEIGSAGGLVQVARNIAQNVGNSLGVSSSISGEELLGADVRRKYTECEKLLYRQTIVSLNEAVLCFNNVIDLEPDFLPAYAKLVETFRAGFNVGDFEIEHTIGEVKKIVREMRLRAPETPEALVAEAIVRSWEHTPEPADAQIDLLTRAKASGPNYFPAFREAAFVFLINFRYRDAVEAYKRALEFDPVSPELLANASWAYYNVGDFDEATRLAEKNIRLNKDNSVAQEGLARVYRWTGRQEEALELLSGALKANKGLHVARWELAGILANHSLFEEAIEYAPAPAYKAYFSALHGDFTAAKNYADQLPHYYDSRLANYFAGSSQGLYTWLTGDFYLSIRGGQSAITSPKDFFRYVFDASVLKKHEDNRYKQRLGLAKEYLSHNSDEDFRSMDQYLGAIGYHVLMNDLDEAISLLKLANERKFVFLDYLRRPLFLPLAEHKDFDENVKWMRRNSGEFLSSAKLDWIGQREATRHSRNEGV